MAKRPVLLGLAAFLLAACGGGGNGASADVTVSRTPTDLRFGEPTRTPSGAPILFRFTVANAGPDEATDVHVSATLGANLTLVNMSCESVRAHRVECPAGNVIPSLPPDASLSFVVEAAEQARASFDATATFGATAAADRNRANDSLTIALHVWVADLRVEYAAPAATPAGGDAEFVATVYNDGPDDAEGLAFDWLFPPDTPRSFMGCREIGDSVCQATSASGSIIPAGAHSSFVYAIVAPSDGTSEVSSTFSVASSADPDTTNNSASASTIVAP